MPFEELEMRFGRALTYALLAGAALCACETQAPGDGAEGPLAPAEGTGGTGATGGFGATGGTGGASVVEVGCLADNTRTLRLKEVSELGFSAEQALGLALGAHSASVAWATPSDAVTLEVTPAPGQTELELTVTYDKGEIRYVERSLGASSEAEASEDCSDLMEIDVFVHVKTDNLAFDDTFPATLVVRTARFASLQVKFNPAKLAGSFGVNVIEPVGGEAKQFIVDASFTQGGFAGSISSIIQVVSSVITSTNEMTYAEWPKRESQSVDGGTTDVDEGADDTPSIPVDISNDGFVKDAWDSLLLSAPLTFAWQTGDATTLTLELTSKDGRGRYEVTESGMESVTFDISAVAKTADGRIDGTWDLSAWMMLNTLGHPSSAALLRYATDGTLTPATFETSTGISGVDFKGQDHAGFELQLDYDFEGTAPVHSGIFSVVGMVQPACGTPDSNDAPSCNGIEVTELEAATLSD